MTKHTALHGKNGRQKTKKAKSGHARFLDVPIGDILESPENATVYRPVDPKFPDIQALAESVGEYGILQAWRERVGDDEPYPDDVAVAAV